MKIAIIGMGLMGGSLALCFRGNPGMTVIGQDISQENVSIALESGAIDRGAGTIEAAADNADFIFLCVPVGCVEDYLRKLQQLPLKSGCIITDVGSTKASICRTAESLDWGGAFFIGGHPMAGSERSGIEAATRHLYENAFYVLTPTPHTPEAVYAELEQLLAWTKAQIVRVDPLVHDDIAGSISHLPHIIAVALVNQVAKYNEGNPLYRNLAAGGFRDITRIASSEPNIWRDILLGNREVVLRLLKEWNTEIAAFAELLERGDGEAIAGEFERSRRFRSQIPEHSKGMIVSQYDIYVDIPDHPGIIGQVASQLGREGINLSNIQIIESRDEVPGVLRLSFRNERDMDRAVKLLKTQYPIHL